MHNLSIISKFVNVPLFSFLTLTYKTTEFHLKNFFYCFINCEVSSILILKNSLLQQYFDNLVDDGYISIIEVK